MMIKTEVAVFNIASALNAQSAGAGRIELCDNPAEGGTTPSAGVMDAVRRKVNIDVMVMIRPRGGDFVYSADEYEAMKYDIMAAKRMGMDGVVFGILDMEGRIDIERCRELILLAKPMQVTCHRAFDRTPDAMDALEACVAAGFDRILTSGREQGALQGKPLLARLVKATEGRIIILAGVGINDTNVTEIVEATGVGEVHFSARVWKESDAARHNNGITLVDPLPSDHGVFIADTDRIRAVIKAIAEI